jgi:hypothetical protein
VRKTSSFRKTAKQTVLKDKTTETSAQLPLQYNIQSGAFQQRRPSSNAYSVTRVKTNANNYLPKAENYIIGGLASTL